MTSFHEYKNKYELMMERTDGILTLTMHANGGSHIHYH